MWFWGGSFSETGGKFSLMTEGIFCVCWREPFADDGGELTRTWFGPTFQRKELWCGCGGNHSLFDAVILWWWREHSIMVEKQEASEMDIRSESMQLVALSVLSLLQHQVRCDAYCWASLCLHSGHCTFRHCNAATHTLVYRTAWHCATKP